MMLFFTISIPPEAKNSISCVYLKNMERGNAKELELLIVVLIIVFVAGFSVATDYLRINVI